MSFLLSLASDVTLEILGLLDPRTLCSLATVCKQFSCFITDPALWKKVAIQEWTRTRGTDQENCLKVLRDVYNTEEFDWRKMLHNEALVHLLAGGYQNAKNNVWHESWVELAPCSKGVPPIPFGYGMFREVTDAGSCHSNTTNISQGVFFLSKLSSNINHGSRKRLQIELITTYTHFLDTGSGYGDEGEKFYDDKSIVFHLVAEFDQSVRHGYHSLFEVNGFNGAKYVRMSSFDIVVRRFRRCKWRKVKDDEKKLRKAN